MKKDDFKEVSEIITKFIYIESEKLKENTGGNFDDHAITLSINAFVSCLLTNVSHRNDKSRALEKILTHLNRVVVEGLESVPGLLEDIGRNLRKK